MKPNKDIFAMLADAGAKKLCPESLTIKELVLADPMKRSRRTWQDIADKLVIEGKWEKAYKLVNGRICRSYVRKKQ